MLTVGMNHISDHLNGVYPLKTTKTGLKYDQLLRGCDSELKMELLKLLAIQSKISGVNLLMKVEYEKKT